MELYMMNRPHGRMILASVEKGSFVWPSITVEGVTKLKDYTKLTPAEAIQADCDIKAINIILQGLPTEIYALCSKKGDDPIDAINHLKSFLMPLSTSWGDKTTYAEGITRKYTPGASGSNTGKQWTVICYNCKWEGHISKQYTMLKRKRDEKWFNDKVLLVQAQAVSCFKEEEYSILGRSKDSDTLNISDYCSHGDIFPGMAQMHSLSANKALTTELDRYKEEVKDLKEMQNVENSFSGSNEQYAEIEHLKQTLSEQVQEKDSLMKIKIKQLDNIIFKRGQSAQTVHMMTKSKICYDHSTKQAISFEKPFYLKKVRESKPKLYDGNVILKMDAIVILDSDETLMLCEESRSKMLLKEQDPMVVKHKVNTKPINYVVLNNDYNKRFVRQSDLYSEHADWKATSVPPLDPSHSSTTNKVEVSKELLKVSMVHTSLKELKRHLTGFDQVVKERTTATAITEGTWGFEHTKAFFLDGIIPFIKELKDIFNKFNQYLVDELADVQNVFYQMEQAVEQHRLESRTLEVKMNQVLSENERLLAQAIDHDIVKTVVNLSVNDGCETVNECQKSQSQEKDIVIVKLKEQIKFLKGNVDDSKVKMDMDEIETLNIEFEHRNSKKHDNSDYVCTNGDDCMSFDNLCVSNSMNDVKFRAKPKKRKSKKEIWNPTGKVFTKIGYIWRPTGRTFTIVGNACPLTRITTTNEVPSRKQ
ncbi:hypothetical protein Tco_0926384 [Tanacetum coccineum]|uniref:Uncharacterized protein n=1 Tax=Tanacetum coccineum TaxID=301880 RepID=A0ABQ5DAS3_9ASTR